MADQPLSGDARELVNGTPEPAGAAPTEPGSGAVPAGQTDTPPAGFAPIRSLQAEQKNTAQARQEAANYRAALELAGHTFDEQGNVYAPQPRAPEPTSGDKAPQEFVDAYNSGDPEALYRFMRRTAQEEFIASAPGYMDPFAQRGAEQYKRDLAATDPDYPVYKATFERILDQRVRSLPAHLQPLARISPDVVDDARARAIMHHRSEIVTKEVERRANPGRVVGTWTEGARPSQDTSAPPQLSPEYHEWGKSQGVSDEILARAAQLKAEREGRR